MRELINVHHSHLGKFNTGYGHEIDIRNPDPENIQIEDIAHALSHICRFGGHCFPFYSVAQHCVLVMALAPENLKLAALLHDASEAYLGDIIKPLKILLGNAYSDYEERFDLVIANKFGIDKKDLEAVKEFDKLALEIEHKAVVKGNFAHMILVLGENGLLKDNWAWSAPYAETLFLQAFEELYKPEITYSEHE